jgi:hypothetical protein
VAFAGIGQFGGAGRSRVVAVLVTLGALISPGALALACSGAPAPPAVGPAGASSGSASASSSAGAASASASVGVRESVRFGRGEIVVGARQRFESDELITVVRGPKGAAAPTIVEGERVRATEEVLATNGPLATKVRVSFETWGRVSDDGESARLQQGKTYVVERLPGAGGLVKVASASGGVVPADEAEPIAKRYDRIGEPIELGLVLPDRALFVGDRIAELEAAIPGRLFSNDDPMRPSDVVVKLVGLEEGGSVAIFEISMKLGGKQSGDTAVESKLAGKLRLRVADARELEIVLEGPVQTRPKGGAVSFSGRLRLRSAHVYL